MPILNPFSKRYTSRIGFAAFNLILILVRELRTELRNFSERIRWPVDLTLVETVLQLQILQSF